MNNFWYILSGQRRCDKLINKALGRETPTDTCPACKYKGPHVRHNTLRYSTCPRCGNIFMGLEILKSMERTLDYTYENQEGPQIESTCPIPRCKSTGPFVFEQGTSYLMCCKCGNVFMPVGLVNDLKRQLESQPVVSGKLKKLGSKRE